jgi:hypothetical protein
MVARRDVVTMMMSHVHWNGWGEKPMTAMMIVITIGSVIEPAALIVDAWRWWGAEGRARGDP